MLVRTDLQKRYTLGPSYQASQKKKKKKKKKKKWNPCLQAFSLQKKAKWAKKLLYVNKPEDVSFKMVKNEEIW